MNVAFLSRQQSNSPREAVMAIELLEALGENATRALPAALPQIRLFDIEIDNVTMEQAVAAIVDRLKGETAAQVSFVNADCVNIACRNREYLETLQQSDLVFADGIGVRVAGKVLGQPVRDNVNGTDMFPRLAAALQGSGNRVYLLGGREGVAEGVAGWLNENYPGVEVAGWRNGYFSADEEGQVIEDIRKSGADLVLVAFGAPRQEVWIRRNLSKLGAKVAVGVGGLFDFYCGRVPRAPHWIRQLGMEWCYRLYREPQRLWRRYLVGNFVFLARVARLRFARG
jgi:N-acetylglucosaminyldiphosphoundecaprenol N-acetyl-beta-D-mannosaminyltransferase